MLAQPLVIFIGPHLATDQRTALLRLLDEWGQIDARRVLDDTINAFAGATFAFWITAADQARFNKFSLDSPNLSFR